ncbi:MAG TPA: hypothetical protein VH877_31965 [Polyangia bacterium]|jgi:hypothetical protein|nr:hypothetical protein [Polyangia bacterium]
MRRQILRVLAFSALALVGGGSGWARAEPPENCPCQQREPYGSYLGVGIVSISTLHRGEGSFLRGGNGFRLVAGERISQHVALELNWQRSYHARDPATWHRGAGDLRLNALAFDLKLYLSGRGPVQGYFVGGAGVYLLADNRGIALSGPGLQGGLGIDFWLSPWARITLQAQYRGANMLDQIRDRRLYLSMATGLIEFAVQL